eukprot:3483394-Rhodomonas_salina.1
MDGTERWAVTVSASVESELLQAQLAPPSSFCGRFASIYGRVDAVYGDDDASVCRGNAATV